MTRTLSEKSTNKDAIRRKDEARRSHPPSGQDKCCSGGNPMSVNHTSTFQPPTRENSQHSRGYPYNRPSPTNSSDTTCRVTISATFQYFASGHICAPAYATWKIWLLSVLLRLLRCPPRPPRLLRLFHLKLSKHEEHISKRGGRGGIPSETTGNIMNTQFFVCCDSQYYKKNTRQRRHGQGGWHSNI